MGGQITTAEVSMQDTAMALYALSERAAEYGRALDVDSVLGLLPDLTDAADQLAADTVQVARDRGASWQHIGDQLGVTRSAVHKRWADRIT